MIRRALLLACAAASVAGCTGLSTGGAAEGVPTPVPNQVPDDVEAVTDPPRTSETDVVLSFVGWDEESASVQVGGYVSPVVEDGGTCTVVLTKDDRVVTATGTGFADATTTVCGGLAVSGTELSAGVWAVVLRYESAGASGTSEATTVDVPA